MSYLRLTVKSDYDISKIKKMAAVFGWNADMGWGNGGCWPIQSHGVIVFTMKSPCAPEKSVDEHVYAIMKMYDEYESDLLKIFTEDEILSKDLFLFLIRVNGTTGDNLIFNPELVDEVSQRGMNIVYKYTDISVNILGDLEKKYEEESFNDLVWMSPREK